MIQRALLSVSDKTGVVDLARALAAADVEILSTGGTAALLADAGVPVIEVADFTGFPEMLDGRVKTLHPKIHGGILGCRDRVTHQEDMQAAGIAPIDLVVVNLYPFAATVARPDCTFADAIENIDIGGPAMVRSAAKNHADVAVVVDPADYPQIIDELQASGCISAATRLALAKKAFAHTAAYDGAIANWLTALEADGSRGPFPQRLTLQFERILPLRYGENPHQQAAFYRDPQPAPGTLAGFVQLQGKDLSYNNLMDADAAWECVKSLPAPACVIVKHANPCGAATAATVGEAWQRALAADPVSAFGGIIAFNAPLDEATANGVAAQFCEVVIAPAVSAAARAALAGKPNVRVLEVPAAAGAQALDFRRIGGGLLVQSADWDDLTVADFEIVSRLTPTPEQLNDMLFAWKIVRFVKSNAIVFAVDGRTLGIGAGQMSRVDASRIAAAKARQMNHDLSGSAVASDAFFPFRDGVDLLAEAGAACVVHPGGGIRDAEITAAADELGLVLALTRRRHFRH